MEPAYKTEKTLDERKKNSAKYLAKYPDKIPIILYSNNQKNEKLIKNSKYNFIFHIAKCKRFLISVKYTV